jgi:hypothetical protein
MVFYREWLRLTLVLLRSTPLLDASSYLDAVLLAPYYFLYKCSSLFRFCLGFPLARISRCCLISNVIGLIPWFVFSLYRLIGSPSASIFFSVGFSPYLSAVNQMMNFIHLLSNHSRHSLSAWRCSLSWSWYIGLIFTG